MKRRILSVLLAVCLIASCLPFTASAATSGKCGDNVTWSLSGSTLTISGTGEMYDYDCYESNPTPWYSERSWIKSVIIKNGVTRIGRDALYDCTSLTNVIIDDSVSEIGAYAFYDCSSLSSINIPSSVEIIGEGALFQTPYVKNIADENGFSILNGILLEYSGPGGSVVIPDSVTRIGEYAFSSSLCESNIVHVTIPSSVKEIGKFAFLYRFSLSKH